MIPQLYTIYKLLWKHLWKKGAIRMYEIIEISADLEISQVDS